MVGNGIDNDKEGLENYNYIWIWFTKVFKAFCSWINLCNFYGVYRRNFGTQIRYPYFATNVNLELNKIENINDDDYKIDYIINDELIFNIS